MRPPHCLRQQAREGPVCVEMAGFLLRDVIDGLSSHAPLLPRAGPACSVRYLVTAEEPRNRFARASFLSIQTFRQVKDPTSIKNQKKLGPHHTLKSTFRKSFILRIFFKHLMERRVR